MSFRLFCIVLSAFGMSALIAQNAAQPLLPTVILQIGEYSIRAEVADDDVKRATGLMFRESLAEDSGMLFVMPRIEHAAFYMKNTRIPLSIAFLDFQGNILEIHDMEPLSEKVVRSAFPNVAYALEMPQGWFSKKNIWPGERMSGLPARSANIR